MRYIKTGNRQVNAALHRIAMTRLRDGAGQVYYRKRIAMGGWPANALRCLKRRLARVVYNRLKADTETTYFLCSALPL